MGPALAGSRWSLLLCATVLYVYGGGGVFQGEPSINDRGTVVRTVGLTILEVI